MSWDSLLSGLIGSVIGGIIGGIVGFLGSRRLQRDAEESQRKAAGRAVLAEMFTNADRALSAESTRVFHEFLDAAWRAQLPLVARSLTWPDLKKVLDAYDVAARAFENAKDGAEKLDERHVLYSSSRRRREENLSAITFSNKSRGGVERSTGGLEQ